MATDVSSQARSLVRSRLAAAGFWLMLDQAVFGLSTLAIGVVLARLLPEAEYGAYATGFSMLGLVGLLQAGGLIEPLLIFGARDQPEQLRRRVASTVIHQFIAATGIAIVLALAAWLSALIWPSVPTAALLGTAFALPSVLLIWLLRRASYVLGMARVAPIAGCVQLVLTLAGVAGLAAMHALHAWSAFIVLGLSSQVVGWVIMRLASVSIRDGWTGQRAVFQEHSSYAGWALLSAPLQWVPSSYYFIALPAMDGLAATATFRAMLNLVQPVTQAQAALNPLLITTLAHRVGTPGLARFVWKCSALLVGGAMLYLLVVVATGPWLIDLLYGGAYRDGLPVLYWLAAIPALAAVSGILGSLVRASQRPDFEFYTHVFASLASLAVGLWAMQLWSSEGAAMGYCAGYVVMGASKLYFAVRVLRSLPAAESAP